MSLYIFLENFVQCFYRIYSLFQWLQVTCLFTHMTCTNVWLKFLKTKVKVKKFHAWGMFWNFFHLWSMHCLCVHLLLIDLHWHFEIGKLLCMVAGKHLGKGSMCFKTRLWNQLQPMVSNVQFQYLSKTTHPALGHFTGVSQSLNFCSKF